MGSVLFAAFHLGCEHLASETRELGVKYKSIHYPGHQSREVLRKPGQGDFRENSDRFGLGDFYLLVESQSLLLSRQGRSSPGQETNIFRGP